NQSGGPVSTETLQHVALFDKCKNFTRADEVRAAGLYAWFKPISQSEDTVVVIEGKPRIMMGSNNYLGLTHHPEVLAAANRAMRERMLQKVPVGTGVMIIVDGVFSMEGDIADVPNLLKVAQKYGAALAIDDAHAVGVLGPNGDGTAAHFGVAEDVDLIVGTFSKSLASIGGVGADSG